MLLVDTDMRRPRLHKAFGIPSTPDGLSRAIVGEAEVLDMVRETGVPNLSLLPCGAMPPNPAELLHAERFKRIVERAVARTTTASSSTRRRSGAVTDAAILSRLTDGTLLVAKCAVTSQGDADARVPQARADARVNVLGCILNDLDLTQSKTATAIATTTRGTATTRTTAMSDAQSRDRAMNQAGG